MHKMYNIKNVVNNNTITLINKIVATLIKFFIFDISSTFILIFIIYTIDNYYTIFY
mgnify:CR=1 FL=1